MDKPRITPKDFFLWAGAMAALYASVVAFIALLFDYINYAFPDALQYYSGDPYSSSISYEMASIIVLAPLFVILMRIIHRSIERDASRREVWVRRWALYLTLFVAGAAVAGDLIALVMYFLNGDVTARFLLKVLVIFLVASAGFLHFLADMRDYWEREPKKARLVGWAVGILAFCSIVSGFFIVGTPWEARLYRYDDQKVNDLQNIQYQIVNYWQLKEALPPTLGTLNDPLSNYIVPLDPQSGVEYGYTATGPLSFRLCATFNAETQPYSPTATPARIVAVSGEKTQTPDNWQHDAGEVCFDRTIDPELYPPFSKTDVR